MQGLSAPGFEKLLQGFNLADLEQHRGSVYALWPDLTLAYISPSWQEFAERNGGEPAISACWGLGANVLDAVPPVLQPYYRQLFETGAAAAGPQRPPVHCYECSSPEHYRRFAMHLYPLRDHAALLVVNSLLVEHAHDSAGRPAHPADLALYEDSAGIIRQCSHCRRIQAVGSGHRWDWVPEWVERPPLSTSHTLCGICLDYYYPEDSGEDSGQKDSG